MSIKIKRVFFTLLSVFIILTNVIMTLIFRVYDYKSNDFKAINDGVPFSMSMASDDNILYKYENSKSELCVFSDCNDKFCIAFLNKINLFGLDFYRYKNGTEYFSRTYGDEYIKAGKNLYYIFLANDSQINYIDSCGYTPEGQYVRYVDDLGKIHYGWLYVVDTKNNHTSDNEFTNYKNTKGEFS